MTVSDTSGLTFAHDSEGSLACEACGHDLSSHDAISGRFCRASVDNGLERVCICAAGPNAPTGAAFYGRGRPSTG
jgi:hypothetical protein